MDQMNNPQKPDANSLTLLGTRILIGIALLWTVALLGGGFWWFIQRSSRQSNPTEQADQMETFAQVKTVPVGVFSYGGSNAWAPIRLKVDAPIQAERVGFQLRYVVPNQAPSDSGMGIRMLLNDQLSFAQSDRPLTPDEYRQAEQRGFKLKQIPVAIDGIAVAVNPSLDLPGLTLENLRGIYTGKIDNWKAVGGPNLPITLLSNPVDDSGTVQFFADDVLGGQPFGRTIEFIPTPTQALRRLAETPGGIYFASAAVIVPQCLVKTLPIAREPGQFVAPYAGTAVPPEQCQTQRNQVNTQAFRSNQYPMTRYLYVVIKANGRSEEQAGTAYADLLLTHQAQDAIANAGFVRIR